MSRVALIGEGPLPGPATIETAFAQLRLSQFATGLGCAHDVHIVDTRTDDVGAALRRIRPDCVITAGTYGPTRAALAAIRDEPLCVDLPGDPFADAQMVAAHDGEEVVAAEARAVFLPALARADACTTISTPSRHALVGQLGVLGRLARTPPGTEWVHVAPVAWHFPGHPEACLRPGLDGTRAPRVALIGGFNTWFDTESLLAGLFSAMDQGPLTVSCVGGPIPGHHTASASAFMDGARSSRHAGRFDWHDRLPPAALADVLRTCTVGVVLDRPGYEPELGSRTRLLFYLHQGLPIVATVRCELARDLAAGGWLREVPMGAPAALADRLLAPGPWAPLPDRAPLRRRYSVANTTASLCAWADHPRRHPVAADLDPLLELAKERDALRSELRAVYGSPTWQMLDRLHRIRAQLRRGTHGGRR